MFRRRAYDAVKLATEKAAHAANTPEDLLREFEKTIERQAPSVREKIKATMESELDRAILANYRDIPTVVELYTTAKLSGAPPKPTHRTFALIIRACTLQIRPPEANPEEPAGAEVEAAGKEQVAECAEGAAGPFIGALLRDRDGCAAGYDGGVRAPSGPLGFERAHPLVWQGTLHAACCALHVACRSPHIECCALRLSAVA